VYDVGTGQLVATLYDAERANNYKANQATFSPTDELVLNDGVLWDVRTQLPLHKFDKFNQYVSGVFQPHGLEIIINSEVVSFLAHPLTSKKAKNEMSKVGFLCSIIPFLQHTQSAVVYI
jgi:hypothetical protein